MTVRKRSVLVALGLLVAALSLVAAGCGGGDDEGVTALPASSCSDVEYGGEGDPDVLIASDLPLQGGDRVQTLQMQDAIRFVLEQREWKAGDLNVAYQGCDDSTAQAAAWDSGKCSENGQAYAANESMIGLIGTFNSGCAEIIIPLLNQAEGGAIAMVSPANTKVCLTTSVPSCAETEPDKFYPSGERNYGRVVALDNGQAATIAQYAKEDLGLKSVYIINDRQAYGLGLATNLENAFKFLEVEVKGNDAWDQKASSYEAIFNKVKASGAEAVVFSGLVTLNGVKLIKDKFAVLGPNDGVKPLAPDGFTPFTEVDKAGEAATTGMFITVAGSSVQRPPSRRVAAARVHQRLQGGDRRREGRAVHRLRRAGGRGPARRDRGRGQRPRSGHRQHPRTWLTRAASSATSTLNEEGDVSTGAITVYEGPNWNDAKVITPSVELVTAAGGG